VIPPHEGPPSLAWLLLRAHIPISLLCDLAEPDGPNSRQILAAEAVADDVERELAAEHELLRGRGWGEQLDDFRATRDAC
jgi:hypothetical protein